MTETVSNLFKSIGKYATKEGVLDCVAGAGDTALDVNSYDVMKGVDIPSSRNLFAHQKQQSNGAIADRIGSILEIGAGTGMLTLGMLTDSMFDRAVITDISLGMLAVCKARVAAHLPHVMGKTLFATYAGGHDVFADEAFDLVIGNSVLHHIPDYRAFLADMRLALKPGGVAFFTEPSADYHDAMSRAMADSLMEMIATGLEIDTYVRRIAWWISDTRFRLCFPDAPEIRALEDKHIFRRVDLERAGQNANFVGVNITPNFIDEIGLTGAAEYVRELQIPSSLADPFLAKYAKYAERHFNGFEAADRSGMYICIFHC